MLYLLTVMTLLSLGFNYKIYRRITATYPLGTVEEFQLTPVDQQLESHPEQTEANDPQPAAATMTQAVYSAWTNKKEIPWVPPVTPPEPLIKTPNRPLERPDGFV